MSTVNELLERAQKGDINACRDLGWKYLAGYGVAKDYAIARGYYQMAADKGDAVSLYHVANCYLHEGNKKKGIELMKLAAKKMFQQLMRVWGLCILMVN